MEQQLVFGKMDDMENIPLDILKFSLIIFVSPSENLVGDFLFEWQQLN